MVAIADVGTSPGWRFARRAALVLAGTLGALTLLVTSLATGYEWFYRDRILLGVSVRGTDVAALRSGAAVARLRQAVANYNARPVAITYQEHRWELRPDELGVGFDLEATVRAAQAVGRQGSWWRRLSERWGAWRTGRDLPLVLVVDSTRQTEALISVTRSAITPSVPAGLRVVGQRVEVTPSRPGEDVDLAQAAADLKDRMANLSDDPVRLQLIPTRPPVLESDIAQVKAAAELMVSAEVRLHYEDRQWVWMGETQSWVLERSWTISPADLSRMVDFELKKTSQGLQPRVFLNPTLLRVLADEIAGQVNRPPTDVRLGWNDGKPYPTVFSQEGKRLDGNELARLIEQAVVSRDAREIGLPVETLAPAVDMRQIEPLDRFVLLDERRTYYGDSFPERAHNVELGAERLNGAVVGPGVVLSFNRAVGEVSADSGYQMGISIVGDNAVPDAGGGICQVSTTLFQAAFWSGFPILERAPHSYRIRRYGVPGGLDAAVYPPWLDFEFRNTSDDYLLVQARVQNGWLYVALYGKNPGWEVEVSEPEVTDVVPFNPEQVTRYTSDLAAGREIWAERGYDGALVTVRRVVRESGRVIDDYTVWSRYRPQQNVLLVGTGP